MQVTYYVAASLDGFIAEPGGGVDFLSVVGEPEMDAYEEFFGSVDALLMGRRTFDQARSFGDWPYGDVPCWVLTHRDLEMPVETVKAASGSASELITSIAETGAQHLWVVGGADVATQLLKHRLISTITVSVIPAVLGAGVPLFEVFDQWVKLRLVSATPRPGEIVELTYATTG